jgi:metal-dependent amidase/aminoacylase/carboxypeptidase family protein
VLEWLLQLLDAIVQSGCFFFVGAALPGPVRPHHQAVFDFDEVSATHVVISA